MNTTTAQGMLTIPTVEALENIPTRDAFIVEMARYLEANRMATATGTYVTLWGMAAYNNSQTCFTLAALVAYLAGHDEAAKAAIGHAVMDYPDPLSLTLLVAASISAKVDRGGLLQILTMDK